jgi:mevalonate kinase
MYVLVISRLACLQQINSLKAHQRQQQLLRLSTHEPTISSTGKGRLQSAEARRTLNINGGLPHTSGAGSSAVVAWAEGLAHFGDKTNDEQ